jgi:hypothetical protein
MLISHKHKWIFIHIPKNGGSSATNALNSYADVEGADHKELMEGCTPKNDRIDLSFFQHDTASMIKEKLKEQGYDYDSYYKFGIARNPWSRIVSKWTYWHKLAEQGSTFAYAHYVCDKFKTFREFIKSDGRGDMRQTDYIFDNNNIQPQSLKNIPPGVKKRRNWTTTRRVLTEKASSTNTLLVDRIVHLENFEQEMSDTFDEMQTRCDFKIEQWAYDLLRSHKNKSKHKHYTEYYDDETRQIIAEKEANHIEYFGYEFGE